MVDICARLEDCLKVRDGMHHRATTGSAHSIAFDITAFGTQALQFKRSKTYNYFL